jgi:O-antigen ligase
VVPLVYLIPLGAYAALALGLLLSGRRGGALMCLLVASYCGVMAFTFTRGASGGIWLVQLLALLLSPLLLTRPAMPAFDSKLVTRATLAVLGFYVLEVGVGMTRYDPSLEAVKAGAFQAAGGLPLNILMAGYRLYAITVMTLVFVLPLRFFVDRRLFLRLLTVCWLVSLVLSVAQIIHYLDIADLGFTARTELGEEHTDLMGFNRACIGLILVFGIYLSYAMTQLTRSHLLKIIAWLSAPVLVVALLFTWSRAATLAMAVSSISLIITLGGSRAVRGIVVTAFGIAVIHLALSQYPDVAERMRFFQTGEIDEASVARLVTWANLATYLLQTPDILLFGTGFQNFHYFLNLSEAAVGLEAAHNNYLHALAENGIFGFTLFVGWLVSILWWVLKWRRQTTDPTTRVMCGIFLSMMIAALTSSLTQETLSPSLAMVPWTMHFYLILGLWVSWYRGETWVAHQRAAAQARGTRPFFSGPVPLVPPQPLAPADPVVY